jgi:hypothetical protein
MPSKYRLWVNPERTIKAELWPLKDGEKLFIATRQNESDIWGPPVECAEEVGGVWAGSE